MIPPRVHRLGGEFPLPRGMTLRDISNEVLRARKKYPENTRNLESLEYHVVLLRQAFSDHNLGKMTAVQIYALGIVCAGLAIRCVEEGTGGSRYGNRDGEFKLEPTP